MYTYNNLQKDSVTGESKTASEVKGSYWYNSKSGHDGRDNYVKVTYTVDEKAAEPIYFNYVLK